MLIKKNLLYHSIFYNIYNIQNIFLLEFTQLYNFLSLLLYLFYISVHFLVHLFSYIDQFHKQKNNHFGINDNKLNTYIYQLEYLNNSHYPTNLIYDYYKYCQNKILNDNHFYIFCIFVYFPNHMHNNFHKLHNIHPNIFLSHLYNNQFYLYLFYFFKGFITFERTFIFILF